MVFRLDARGWFCRFTGYFERHVGRKRGGARTSTQGRRVVTQQMSSPEKDPPQGAAIHIPSLFIALTIMLVGSVYPLLFAGPDGKADHGLATALFWAMSAGLVRGVGFVPRAWVWRLFFSGWSCVVALLLAGWLRFGV